jgi:hypothetical protein
MTKSRAAVVSETGYPIIAADFWANVQGSLGAPQREHATASGERPTVEIECAGWPSDSAGAA